ncbi:MAG TPA: hypothetical protein VNT79_02490, partial [Phycisphaerae bacterium]|nr:hypothetical protein [Phycisphaerae bacterium]
MNLARLITRVSFAAAVALAVYAGCQTSPQEVLEPVSPVSTLSAPLAEVPMEFSPTSQAERTNFINVVEELAAQEPRDIGFGFDAADMHVEVLEPAVDASARSIPMQMTLTLAIAEGANATPCESGVGAGRFVVDVADDGSVTKITPERPELGEIIAAALSTDEVALCTKATGNFRGRVTLRETKIDLEYGVGGGPGNRNENLNRNTNQNSNANSNNNANTNSGDMCGNGNFGVKAPLGGTRGEDGEAKYRRVGPCQRFEVRVTGLAQGRYPVLINGISVGEVNVPRRSMGVLR